MLNGRKLVVVMPAFNAAKTLTQTYERIPHNIVDEVILVDDHSSDNTSNIAKQLGIQHVIRHANNMGYGSNQKTCYSKALELNADVVVMLHPDYQYEPKLITAMASLIAEDVHDCVLASRILGTGALKGGMPLYKYFFNRVLTAYQNLLIPYKLSEYHTGYRAYSKKVLETIEFNNNSDSFIFDNQLLLQIIGHGYNIGEITCPTRYEEDSSSISLRNSIIYGFSVLKCTLEYKLAKLGVLESRLYKK